MRKKMLGILFCLLVTLLVALPTTNAINVIQKNEWKGLTTPRTTDRRPQYNISLPDVDIYYSWNKWKWGDVTFADPSFVIDLNLSDVSSDTVDVGFFTNITCHVKGQLLGVMLYLSININHRGIIESGVSVRRFDNWTLTCVNAYFLIGKVNDSYYPVNVTITPVPVRLKHLANFWWFLDMFLGARLRDSDDLLPFERAHGITAVYTLHVHQ